MSDFNSIDMEVMKVVKRNGEIEEVSFDKVLRRIKNLSKSLNVNPTVVSQKICSQIYNGVKTSELDELGAQICASLATENPDYGILASKIIVSNHHKNTSPSFSETIQILYDNLDRTGNPAPLISDTIYNIVQQNRTKLNSVINYQRDYLFDYFGFKTLEKSYLMKVNGVVIERPQQMLMRVSLGIHQDDFKEAIETYNFMSQKYFIHATPTLFNSGTPRPQLSSCFLLAMKDDSIDGIYLTLRDCALISKYAGGIGLWVHKIRAKNSFIRGTNGISNGLVPMLRNFNSTARYVDQGGGKRNGSIAIYLEPWHADIFDFLLLRKNHGNEEDRARDLFYAMWIPDLFMKRVSQYGKWTLMCPDECPGLYDAWGDKFEELYIKYENEGKGKKTIDAQDLWFAILESQIETGTPYLVYKDACNRKSNQQNLGTIKSSNLCTEIVEYSSPEEYAVCNLASIGLSRYVIPRDLSNLNITSIKVYTTTKCIYCKMAKELLKYNGLQYQEINLDDQTERKSFFNQINTTCQDGVCTINDEKIKTVPQIYINEERIGGYLELLEIMRPAFDFDKLYQISRVITKNLNKVIDINYYPVPETKVSNKRHRPIGIGVQGLADVFAQLKIPYDSSEAKTLNRRIFETIYYGALEMSMEISKKRESLMKKYKELKQSGIGIVDDKELMKLESTLKPIPEELNRDNYLGSYSSFEGSPSSKGLLQFDLWNVEPSEDMKDKWDKLREDVLKYGIRNSLLLAPMPTASTSQILGNNECYEPFTSNIYLRRTLAGEFVVVNKYLIHDLLSINLWNNEIKNKIILNEGSIANLEEIPSTLKRVYKTVWEMSQKDLIDMAIDRGAFICQSQSLNLFIAEPDFEKLTSMHFYAWKNGLKTGIYYLRTRPVTKAQQFTIDPSLKMQSYDNEICESCSA